MVNRAILLLSAGLLLGMLAAPAGAHCVLPEGSRESPQRVAQSLLESVDVLGFGVIVQRQDYRTGRPEIVDIIYSLKGQRGRLQMEYRMRDGAVRMTNSADTFDADAGTIVFAALNAGRDGAVISECTQLLLAAFPTADIVAALHELAPPADRTSAR